MAVLHLTRASLEALNHTLFLYLNAPAQPSPAMFRMAEFFAQDCILVIPLGLAAGCLLRSSPVRHATLEAAWSGCIGLLCNLLIGLLWTHPRPFMIGIGHTLIPHVADSSFPSDHVTVMLSVACSLCVRRQTRMPGLVLVGLSMPVAWARVYLGVHFPFDIVGSIPVALLACLGAHLSSPRVVTPTFRLVTFLRNHAFSRWATRK